MSRDLLEREPELADLRAAALEATGGHGRVVLLHGEAGIGKTSLVSALRADPPDGVRVLVGSCDAMSTPRTLGPAARPRAVGRTAAGRGPAHG